MLNVAKFVHGSKIYGPGTRTIIWFQGCSIKCKGCINPELIPFRNNTLMTVEEVVNVIEDKSVTLLGGEPLDQPKIFDLLNELERSNISVVLFSGYNWNQISLEQRNIISNACILAVTGPYIKEYNDKNLYLRGSSNQQLLVFDETFVIGDGMENYEIIIDNTVEVRGRIDQDIFKILEGE